MIILCSILYFSLNTLVNLDFCQCVYMRSSLSLSLSDSQSQLEQETNRKPAIQFDSNNYTHICINCRELPKVIS